MGLVLLALVIATFLYVVAHDIYDGGKMKCDQIKGRYLK